MGRVPRYQLRVGDYTVQELGSLSLRFSMREIADSFSATINDKVRLESGARAVVSVEGVTRLVGELQVDRLMKQPGVRDLTVRGYSAAQRLVKSDAVVEKRTFKGKSLRAIVEEIVAPFDLVVDVSESAVEIAEEVVDRARVGPGQTAWAFISGVAKRQGCIIVSGAASVTDDREAKSSVRITRVAVRRSPITIVYPSPRVLSIEYENDVRDVHSEIFVNRKGRGQRDPDDGTLKGLDGRAVDERVLYSPKIIQAEAGGRDQASLNRQAEWEMRKRAAEGQRVTVNYDGWSPNNGPALWWPNTVFRVVDTEEGFDEYLVLVSSELGENTGDGAVARLEFLPPDAYAILEQRKIEKGSREGYRANKEYLAQNAELVASIADASDVADFDEANLDLYFEPEDPDA